MFTTDYLRTGKLSPVLASLTTLNGATPSFAFLMRGCWKLRSTRIWCSQARDVTPPSSLIWFRVYLQHSLLAGATSSMLESSKHLDDFGRARTELSQSGRGGTNPVPGSCTSKCTRRRRPGIAENIPGWPPTCCWPRPRARRRATPCVRRYSVRRALRSEAVHKNLETSHNVASRRKGYTMAAVSEAKKENPAERTAQRRRAR